MTDLPQLTFPSWLPAAVKETAEILFAQAVLKKEHTREVAVLCRLTSDPVMKSVWRTLAKQPAYVTYSAMARRSRRRASELRKKGGSTSIIEAKALEFEAKQIGRERQPDSKWSEKDQAVQAFFTHAYHAALEATPILLKELRSKAQRRRNVAEALRALAKDLLSFDMRPGAEKLEEIADDCEIEATTMLPRQPTDDPGVLVRSRGDDELRALVASLSITTALLFDQSLYGAIAGVANAILRPDGTKCEKISRQKIIEILRVPRRVKRRKIV